MRQEKLIRPPAKGMGQALVERSFYREGETWGDLARRVAYGNVNIVGETPYLETIQDQIPSWLKYHQGYNDAKKRVAMAMRAMEADLAETLLAKCAMLLSGRHLQQGDLNQKNRGINVFVNCATADMSSNLFYLLLSGCGVGRCYDDDVMLVDWRNMPWVEVALDYDHADNTDHNGELIYDDVDTLYSRLIEQGCNHSMIEVFEVEDSREGWAKAMQILEVATYESGLEDKNGNGLIRNKIYIFDFSKVRKAGSPIGGMQNRPASGPIAFMEAMKGVARLKHKKEYAPWLSTMWVDHFLADCVVVGGARRSSRIAIKHWREKDISRFITLKKEFTDLYSSNNSVACDDEFWNLIYEAEKLGFVNEATEIYKEITRHSYGTGEPGFFNVDNIKTPNENQGIEEYLTNPDVIGDSVFQLSEGAKKLSVELAKAILNKDYQYIPNPCGEIKLFMKSGYCTIGDGVPYFCDNLDEAEKMFRLIVRMLIRTNLLEAFYAYETKRTNRIGVSITGIFEFAIKFFGYNFFDLIDENKSIDFWRTIGRFRRAIEDEAIKYSMELGVAIPHTNATLKPAGSTSKTQLLTEAAHLPPMREFMRWVQYSKNDPLVAKYETLGYPVRQLKKYAGAVIVGFPTQPEICRLDRSKVVTADEATPEQQFKWLMLLEKWWINGCYDDGTPLNTHTGNQVSYTLKYDPNKVSLEEYSQIVKEYMPKIKACSMMPTRNDQEMIDLYEYLPEDKVTYDEFVAYVLNITDEEMTQGFDFSTLFCEGKGCPEL